MRDPFIGHRLDGANSQPRPTGRWLGLAVAAMAVVTCALAGCSDVRPVSSSNATNLQGSPGTANDLTTGGHGGDFRRR